MALAAPHPQNMTQKKTNAEKPELKDASGWSQHTTKEGKVFWFHAPTNKSTWRKPDVLKTDLEKLMGTQTAWKEYATATGIPYWYNKETKCSVWACPPEVQMLKDELAAPWEEFKDKNIASERLKTLFKLYGVGVRTRFEEALNMIKTDSRFSFFSILTTGEKKQVYAEFQSQIQKQKKERERARKAEARRVFLEVLNKWPGLHPACLLSDFKDLYEKEWWWSCLSSAEHDDLFNDCVEENQNRFEENQRAERQSLRKQLMDFLNNPDHPVSRDLKWADVAELLAKEPKFAEANPRLLMSCWENYVNSKDSEEFQNQSRLVYRAQRKRRDAFKYLIQKLLKSGKINARTSFSSFVEKYSTHPSYVRAVGVPSSTPREMFEYCLEPYITSYEEEKALLKRVFKSRSEWTLSINSKTSFQEFYDHLKQVAHSDLMSQFTETNLQLLLESLKRRAQRRDITDKSSHYKSSSTVQASDHYSNTSDIGGSNQNKEATYKEQPQEDHRPGSRPNETSSCTKPSESMEEKSREIPDEDEEEEEGIVPSISAPEPLRRLRERRRSRSNHLLSPSKQLFGSDCHSYDSYRVSSTSYKRYRGSYRRADET